MKFGSCAADHSALDVSKTYTEVELGGGYADSHFIVAVTDPDEDACACTFGSLGAPEDWLNQDPGAGALHGSEDAGHHEVPDPVFIPTGTYVTDQSPALCASTGFSGAKLLIATTKTGTIAAAVAALSAATRDGICERLIVRRCELNSRGGVRAYCLVREYH